jgi:hypothetical protein
LQFNAAEPRANMTNAPSSFRSHLRELDHACVILALSAGVMSLQRKKNHQPGDWNQKASNAFSLITSAA